MRFSPTPKTSQPTLPSAASRPAQSHGGSRPKRIYPDVPPSDGLGARGAAAASAKIDTLTDPDQGPMVDVDHDAPAILAEVLETNPPLSAVEQGTSYAWRDRSRQTSQA